MNQTIQVEKLELKTSAKNQQFIVLEHGGGQKAACWDKDLFPKLQVGSSLEVDIETNDKGFTNIKKPSPNYLPGIKREAQVAPPELPWESSDKPTTWPVSTESRQDSIERQSSLKNAVEFTSRVVSLEDSKDLAKDLKRVLTVASIMTAWVQKDEEKMKKVLEELI